MPQGQEVESRKGVFIVLRGPLSYDHRPSHPYNAGTEHVGFFTDQVDIVGGGGGTAGAAGVVRSIH